VALGVGVSWASGHREHVQSDQPFRTTVDRQLSYIGQKMLRYFDGSARGPLVAAISVG
jgi:hypothetical protein